MKRLFTMLLCLILALSVLAGCSPNAGIQSGNNEGQVTLTIGLAQNLLVEDYDTNAYTRWLEETTGYNIEFYYFPAGDDAKTKLTTMLLNEEELPDILWGIDVGEDNYVEYGEDGYFLDLTEYMEDKEKSAAFWERLEELDEEHQRMVIDAMQADDGSYYGLARIEESLVDVIDCQMYINQEWLKKLNLEMPTDMESLYNVLVAFNTLDPNGNGNPDDEYPMVGCATASGDIVNYLINNYIYVNNDRWWNVDENGKLYLPHTTNEYREALKYVNRLYKEGLLDGGSLTMNHNELKALVCTTDGVEKVGIWCGHPSLVLEPNHDAVYAYAALPSFSVSVINNQGLNVRTFLTESCEERGLVDEAWNLLMTMYSKESSYRQRYGEKGVDWTEADPGTKSYLGYDAEIKIINDIWNTINNSCWNLIECTVLTNAENENNQSTDDMSDWYQKKMEIMGDCTNAYYAAAEKYNPKVLCPVLARTEEESKETRNQRNNCAQLLNQARNAFILGVNMAECNIVSADPGKDEHWQAYLKTLETYGVDVWQAGDQAVYDRQNSK